MKSSAQRQIFIRNTKGQVWGPLGLDSLALLFDNGLLHGELQVSKDGTHFASPGQFPDVREFFPKELWGAVPREEPKAPAKATRQELKSPPSKVISPIAPSEEPKSSPTTPSEEPKFQPTAPPPTPGRVTGPLEGPPAAGDLDKTSPARLYYLAASASSTGLLRLMLKDRAIEVYFRKGNPEFVSSSHLEDSEADFVVRELLASPEQVSRASAEKDRFGGELIAALFALGALNPSTAFAQLAERSLRLLAKAFSAESGTFSFETRELPPEKALPIGNRWQIFSDLIRRIPTAVLHRRLQPWLEIPLMKSGGRLSVEELRLTPQEMRAYGFVDGVHSLTQLIAAAPELSDHYLRMAFLLQEAETVTFDKEPVPEKPPRTPTSSEQSPKQESKQASPRPAAVSPKPGPAAARATQSASAKKSAGPPPKLTPVRPAPPLQSPASRKAEPAPAIDINKAISDARNQVEALKDQTLFQILGVSESADYSTIKAAYFKLAKSHHPDTVPPGAPAEFGELKAELFGAINQAYQVLSDPSDRANYVEQLRTGISGDVDVAQIFAAEELFQRACAMVRMRMYEASISAFDEAIKANAEEGEFYAWRGYAKFFTYSDKKQGLAEANKDIQTALKKNERCAQAYYFLGTIARVMGDNSRAAKQFQQALSLAPQHTEAQRELRLVSGKR